MGETDSVKHQVRDYILTQFLPGEDPSLLTDETSLIEGGILDSIATMKLVTFLEDRFGITMEAFEIDAENFDSISRIVAFIRSKKG